MLSRRAGRRGIAPLALAALLAATVGVPAHAGPPGAECPPGQLDCNVWDDDPGDPGDPGDGGDDGGGDGGGGGGGGKCMWNGRVIACYDDVLGWFNNSDGCYYKVAEPQPSVPPEGQRWYVQSCNGGAVGEQNEVLLASPPPGFGAPPDPEELARRALASIRLERPRIAIAPDKDKGPGLVGLPVWMWASGGREYFGPIRKRVTDRGLTVRIEAKVDRVVWYMGNGDKQDCKGAGTPYEADGPHAGKKSPDCGYHKGYAKADRYRVFAVTHWTVRWWARGVEQSPPFRQTRTSDAATIRINELQVVAE
ncbi:hypothetical protein [Micromonospora endolithica]|uniref:ATP/GTP-binding protein n=1 Tax=Micromonospora endolithica TaxID=230091 RepID=A0A3A9ZJK1_9ACTN|nr:hypothetical protein [Micromonospora endolithica]RKN48285.1 hypothetical protein D7223_09710 [Micromonospora endolithica]TWJ24659.1 hypothetical protein JD76_04812 [Micromonospora endolithica]